MNRKLTMATLALFAAATILAGCGSNAAPATTGNAELANQAAVYAKEQGYKTEIRTAADGSQSGVVIFPDGTECDEWALYRGECRPEMRKTLPPTVTEQT